MQAALTGCSHAANTSDCSASLSIYTSPPGGEWATGKPYEICTQPHSCRIIYLDEALARQFTTAMRVGKKSKEAGKTISEVGLRGINGLFLFEIERAGGDKLKAVDHDTELEPGDILWFAGEQGVQHLQRPSQLSAAWLLRSESSRAPGVLQPSYWCSTLRSDHIRSLYPQSVVHTVYTLLWWLPLSV